MSEKAKHQPRTDKRRDIERKSRAQIREERREAGMKEINGAWVSGKAHERLIRIKASEGLDSIGAVIEWLLEQVKKG